MRYIRTKDGKVFDIEKIKKEISNNCYYIKSSYEFKEIYEDKDTGEIHLDYSAIGSKENDYDNQCGRRCNFGITLNGVGILKQADTLEELCDAFMLKNPNDIIVRSNLKEIKDLQFYARPIYGGIWIERKLQNCKVVYSLEPIAIMNNKRKFEKI